MRVACYGRLASHAQVEPGSAVQHHVQCSSMCSANGAATIQTTGVWAAQHDGTILLLAVQHNDWCIAMRT